MKAIELLNFMTQCAQNYKTGAQDSIERNRHMNEIEEGEKVQQRHIDATLVDFINHIAATRGVDYGLYTKDLEK